MVDNDINLPASQSVNSSAANTPQCTAALSRRKTLIATRLRQHQQALLEQKQQEAAVTASSSHPNDLMADAIDESNVTALINNEIQFQHDRDSFKCSLCYSDDDYAPSTSVSALNRSPTSSTNGASNFSFDKEQVLKHVLIVHLSFLAYKCDTCAQFYAFDEPQTKQHAALVHQCGTGTTSLSTVTSSTSIATSTESTCSNLSASPTSAAQPPQSNQTCHFKLIKTEEEINLAINKAQQFITKLPASKAEQKKVSV